MSTSPPPTKKSKTDNEINTNQAYDEPFEDKSSSFIEDTVPIQGKTATEFPKCNVPVKALEPQDLSPVKEEPVLQMVSALSTFNEVFFDLETTSLQGNCDIVQIAAAHKNETFNKYIFPNQTISPHASSVTGLTFDNGILSLYGQPVDAHTLGDALQNFLKWIESRSPVFLIAHNVRFDYTRFFYHIQQHNLVKSFQKHVIGFVDTLTLFKAKYPNLKNYKQKTLASELLKKSFVAHNALEDAVILQELYNKTQPHDITNSSVTFKTAYVKWQYNREGNNNKESFSIMINKKCVSENMALKMGKSGLTMTKLIFIHGKYGCKGVQELLTQDKLGKPLITKSKRVIREILGFLCN